MDLGINVNVLSLSIHKKLGIKRLSRKMMTFYFARKEVYGILEDMLVKVEKFIFLVGFMVLDILDNDKIQLIFGMSFLLIIRCNVNLKKCTLTMKVYVEIVKLNVLSTM